MEHLLKAIESLTDKQLRPVGCRGIGAGPSPMSIFSPKTPLFWFPFSKNCAILTL